MRKKFTTKALALILAVVMSFTLIIPETFATNSYDDGEDEAAAVTEQVDEELTEDAGSDSNIQTVNIEPDNDEDYGIQTLGTTTVSTISDNSKIPSNTGTYLQVQSDSTLTCTDYTNRIYNLSNSAGNCDQWMIWTNITNGETLYNSGNTLFEIKRSDIGSIDGRKVSLVIDITRIVVDAHNGNRNDFGGSGSGYNVSGECAVPLFSLWDSTGPIMMSFGTAYWLEDRFAEVYPGFSCKTLTGRHIDYNFSLVWADSGETVDLPFDFVGTDYDQYIYDYNGNNVWNESFVGNDGSYKQYYVWSGTGLVVDNSASNYTTFYPGTTGDSTSNHQNPYDSTGNEIYYRNGFVAVSNNGKFSCTTSFGDYCANDIYILSDYQNIEGPHKTTTNGTSFMPGDEVEFQITQKMGTAYVDVFTHWDTMSIIDTLPTGLTYVDNSASITSSAGESVGGNFTYTGSSGGKLTFAFDSSYLSSLSNYNGQTYTITFKAKVDSGYYNSSLTNSVVTDVNTLEYGPSEVTVTTAGTPKLGITKDVNTSTAKYGDDITYTIKVQETGDEISTNNVVITDTLPDELTLVSATSNDCLVSTSGNDFTGTLSKMDYGDVITITVVATVNTYDDVSIVNTAYAKSDECSQVQDSATVTVSSNPELDITKDVDVSSVKPNTDVTYTIRDQL